MLELAVEKIIITGEEYYALVGDDVASELVAGEIVKQMPTGWDHGEIEAFIVALLVMFNRKHKLGKVSSGETGVYVKRDPDTIRGVDAAFITYERLGDAETSAFLTVAPELVVEVLSPGNSYSEMQTKLDEYFGIGVDVVWIVDPALKTVQVYESRTEFAVLTTADTLTCSVLPGFEAAVSEIFAR